MKISKSLRVFLISFLLAIPLTFLLQACAPDEDYYRQRLDESTQRTRADWKSLELYDCVEDDNVCLYLTSKDHRITYMDRCAVLVTKNVKNGAATYEADLFCDAD